MKVLLYKTFNFNFKNFMMLYQHVFMKLLYIIKFKTLVGFGIRIVVVGVSLVGVKGQFLIIRLEHTTYSVRQWSHVSP